MGCGYDLRGLPTPICPECGKLFDPIAFAEHEAQGGCIGGVGAVVSLLTGLFSLPLAIGCGLDQIESRHCGACCRMHVSTIEPAVIWIVIAWIGFGIACRWPYSRRLARLGAIAATTAWVTMEIVLQVEN
jgi:hypothetical protein